MTDRPSDQRVNDELALLQVLGDSRRVASFKAMLARHKRTARLASRRNVDFDKAVRWPSREPAALPLVAAPPQRSPAADLEATPSAD